VADAVIETQDEKGRTLGRIGIDGGAGVPTAGRMGVALRLTSPQTAKRPSE